MTEPTATELMMRLVPLADLLREHGVRLRADAGRVNLGLASPDELAWWEQLVQALDRLNGHLDAVVDESVFIRDRVIALARVPRIGD